MGFDIGTNSVGWAVTDKQYKLYKCNGHKMWGVRLFEEAQTAEARRLHRSNRRRLSRRKNRIKILQELFAEEIFKVDPSFFQRLEDSKYYKADKSLQSKYSLFATKNYTDTHFHNAFPTIYHLRSALIENTAPKDIRLVYLALHHILKHRGHFLYPGEQFNLSHSLDENIIALFHCDDLDLDTPVPTLDYIQKIKSVILNPKLTKTDKKRQLKVLFNHSKQLESIFGLAVGTKESLSNLFNDPEYIQVDSEFAKISFSEKPFEEELRLSYEEILADKIQIIDLIKKIYDTLILSSIIENGKTLSASKITLYNKHNEQLKILKAFIKNQMPDAYNEIFNLDSEKCANYKSYSGNGSQKCSREDFYKFLKTKLDKLADHPVKDSILEELALETYLPLQKVKENGVIPYQLHEEELLKILENASTDFPFLNKEDKDGLSTKEKIHMLLTFKIPYYVGPLNTTHANKTGFAWAVKNSPERIMPWNFERVIDLEASHEKFINKMTNKCTYLKGEDVLPKNSLLYSEFMLLNELNNIKYNGSPLSPSVRNLMVDTFFKNCEKKNRVTVKKIEDFLRKEGLTEGKITITGIDTEIKTDLKSYRDFKNILGEKFDYTMVEEIIRWITLYANESKLVEKRIQKNYGTKLSTEEIKKISKLKYKDWGRLSRKFLTQIECDDFKDYATNQPGNIINTLRHTNFNLMQIMSNQYDFSKKVTQINTSLLNESTEFSYSLLDDLYVSPSVKRMIWQTLLIMEEIKKIMGHEPEKIFIETIRSGKADKKPTNTRKKRLLDLYTHCKEDDCHWAKELNNYTDAQLRSKKLYLYFIQMGRCMYSNEPIDIEKLMRGEAYDIDHIYPRSKTKDDSFDNLVLVKKELNALKTDNFPLDSDIQKQMKPFWDILYQKSFISQKKYERLTRKSEFTQQELADFIARQLVETSQSTKAVAELMTRLYQNAKVVYVKGENVSDFRHKQNFLKIRELNDFHHANDAYLNIVVGNIYDVKFTATPIHFIKDASYRAYNLERIFEFKVERSGYLAWDGLNGHCIKRVKTEMQSRDIRITRRVAQQKGQLFDLTLHKKDECKEGAYLGTKNKDSRLADVTKYGGYKNIKIAYFKVYYAEIENKKGKAKFENRLIGIPLYLTAQLNDSSKVKDYIQTQIKLKKDEKIVALKLSEVKLRIGSLVQIDGHKYYVGGKTNESFYANSAIQLSLPLPQEIYLKELVKYSQKTKLNRDLKVIDFGGQITPQDNAKFYDILVEKMQAPHLFESHPK